jgi:hypothetical protein
MPFNTSLNVAFPVKVANRKSVRSSFRQLEQNQGLNKTVGRLTGGSIAAPGVIKRITEKRSEAQEYLLCELSNGSSVLVTSFFFKKEPSVDELLAVSHHRNINNNIFELGLSLVLEEQVFGVVGVTSQSGDLLMQTPANWVKLESPPRNIVFKSRISRQIITRVGIERALLTWAVSPVRQPKKLIWAALSGFRVRRWPVALLSDLKKDAELLQTAREQFNLQSVRIEVLERARSWWTVTAVILALLSFTFAVLQIWGVCEC